MLQDPQSDTVKQAQQPPQGQGQPGDPKTAAVYKNLVIAAMKIVYDENVSKGLLDILKQGEDPAQAIAMAANSVLEKIKENVKGIHPNFVYLVAPNVIVFVTEIGDAAGVFKGSADLVKQATLALQAQLKGQMQQAAPVDQPAAQPTPEPEPEPEPQAQAMSSEGVPRPGGAQGLVESAMGGS